MHSQDISVGGELFNWKDILTWGVVKSDNLPVLELLLLGLLPSVQTNTKPSALHQHAVIRSHHHPGPPGVCHLGLRQWLKPHEPSLSDCVAFTGNSFWW